MSVKSESTVRYREDLREQIRLELESTRVTFHELLNEISTEGLTKPSLNPAWNISEMLFHMSLAVRNLPSDVRLIRNLKWFSKLPAKPFNRLNIYLARRGARNATKETFAKAYDQAHARTIQTLKKV